MRTLFTILLSMVLMGSAPLVSAGAAPSEEPEATSKGVESMSEQGADNSNSPATGDQLKGQERADERKAMNPSGEEEDVTSKSKKKEKSKEK